MTKKDHLEILMLLSALESWCYADGRRLADWIVDRLESTMEKLKDEVLEER